MSGLSRTPGKRVYGESRTAGSNPALSATDKSPQAYGFTASIPCFRCLFDLWITGLEWASMGMV